jgi:myo-inositol 2-dehydrogenase/D-chiro-inositol 1-dehydrogenase
MRDKDRGKRLLKFHSLLPQLRLNLATKLTNRAVNVYSYAGGIFHDCAVHDIDVMCWVLGEYPYRVTAHVYAHIPEIAAIGVYDTVAVVLSFPSGTIGMIDLSRSSTYGYDQRLEVGPRHKQILPLLHQGFADEYS